MNCPVCQHAKTDCTDSRPVEGNARRRRYACRHCHHRFSTMEVLSTTARVDALLHADENAKLARRFRIVQEQFTRLLGEDE